MSTPPKIDYLTSCLPGCSNGHAIEPLQPCRVCKTLWFAACLRKLADQVERYAASPLLDFQLTLGDAKPSQDGRLIRLEVWG